MNPFNNAINPEIQELSFDELQEVSGASVRDFIEGVAAGAAIAGIVLLLL